jgi:alpha,alpha-trehalose phosphorylase
MITHRGFSVDGWQVREHGLDIGLLASSESLFALSNGHIGWRGNLDEGEPHGLPGSYLNGVYEDRPIPQAEAGYGNPESGEVVINITNGKLIRLLVDDEPFDVRYGQLRSHERVLDMRAGTLDRTAEWVSPAGRTVRVTSRRLVSLTQRAIAAVRYEVEPLDGPAWVVVQSELVANEQLPPSLTADPRKGFAVEDPLQHEIHDDSAGGRALLIHRTKQSRIRVAAAMAHNLDCPGTQRDRTGSRSYDARYTVSAHLAPGQRLCLEKFVGYGWSAVRSSSALRDQVEGALTAAQWMGWERLLAQQRSYLDDFWDRADVRLDGDDEVQHAVRFALFHVLQASARAEERAIAAKGLTGPGYDGHSFWDTETYVLPVLTALLPQAARAALTWRHSTLDRARRRAAQLGLRGAAFPWRTIEGRECSGYWPAGTAAFHVNADIADAVIRYVTLTGDRAFEAGPGLELLAETARLWASLGYHDAAGRFCIDGVTGPDEYTALADNNTYTNLMAQQNLEAAARAARDHPDEAAALGVTGEEISGWEAAAQAMLIPYDEKLGVHPQDDSFTAHQEWDFAATAAGDYPLMAHSPYFQLYRKQVVKQADLVLAMLLRPEKFTAEQKAANFAYYERLTVRDSSLSAAPQAVIAAEVGHLRLAHDYAAEAALIDLADLEHNAADGLHLAALAGSWTALVAGFGGMRLVGGEACFSPRLPETLRRLAFSVCLRGRKLTVDVRPDRATYSLDSGDPLDIRHHGGPVRVTAGRPQQLPIPPAPRRPEPAQPPGREPFRRKPAAQPGQQ